MSWLYSMIIAGLVFSSQNNLPLYTNFDYANSNLAKIAGLDETERFEQTYPLNANGKISVSNINGSISIETWDNPQVKLEYVKTGSSKEILSQVDVKIEARQESFSVETNYGSYDERKRKNYYNSDKLQVDYHLFVPRTAVLDGIETVNGAINISNAANMTRASAVNGQIRATNLRGTANLSTVNGMLEANFDQLQSGSRISLNTVNGTVNLIIPSDANATVKADTVNGNISNDFGLPVRKGKYVGENLYGKIGSGEVQIKLNSVNGGLTFKHPNDGRSLNPAVNLLPAKNGDEDWDADDNNGVFKISPPKPPQVPMPPVAPNFDGSKLNAETRRGVEQALKDAEKEIGEIDPEMRKRIEEELEKANAGINLKQIQLQIKLAREKYREAMARTAANFNYGSPNIETKSDSLVVKGIPKVTVEAGNRPVRVRGWDKPEVQYFITRISKTSAQKSLELKAEQNGQEINLKIADTGGAAQFNESNLVRVEVYVPKKSNLKIVTSGEIRLEGVSGEINLSGADGAVNVRDADGKMEIASTDGAVRVIGFRGEMNARSVDGNLALEGDFQKLSAQTADGNIILTLPDGANVNIESNRKKVQSDGVSMVYVGDSQNISTWKIGGGGEHLRLLSTSDGEIFVRSAAVMKSN